MEVREKMLSVLVGRPPIGLCHLSIRSEAVRIEGESRYTAGGDVKEEHG
jgi:hypothetical protein